MDLKNKNIIYYIFFAMVGLGILSFFDQALAAGAILLFFLVFGTMLLFDRLKIKSHKIYVLFFVAIIIHLAFALFVYYFHFYPFGGGSGDQDGYHAVASQLATKLHHLDFSLGDALKYGHYYPIIMGYVYALTVSSTLIGQIFNVWIVALIAVLAYFLALEITGEEKGSLLAGLVVIFYPSLLFYGSLMLKDACVVLFLMAGAFLSLKLLRHFTWKYVILFYVFSAALFNFRFYIGYALVISFLISWFLFSRLPFKQRALYGLFFFIILGFLPFCYPGQGYWGVDSAKRYLNKDTITMYREYAYTEQNWTLPPEVKNVATNSVTPIGLNNQTVQTNQVTANNQTSPTPQNQFISFIKNIGKPAESRGTGSSFILKTDLNNPFLFVLNMFKSFLYALLGPFPWQINSLRQISALFETLPWYGILYLVITGIIKKMKTQYKNILPILGLSIMMLGVISLFIANFGVVTRIRMPAFILLLCLSPLFYEKENSIYRVFDRFNSFFKNAWLRLKR